MSKRKRDSEMMDGFYKWTLEESKKENVGQDVIYFRHAREQFSKIKRKCFYCGEEVGAFSQACAKCVLKELKKENEKRGKA